MSANGNGQFREDELVSRRVKVGNEWQTRVFPIIGGRLRILHESNDHLSIQTKIVKLDNDFVVVKAQVESQREKFNGTGTTSSQRDVRLADSLVELAETRAIARALRFGGIGVEYMGAEEVSHVASAEPEQGQSASKEPVRVFPESNGNGKTRTKASHDAIDPKERIKTATLRHRAGHNRTGESLVCSHQEGPIHGTGHSEHAQSS